MFKKKLLGIKEWFQRQLEPLTFRQKCILAILSLVLPLGAYIYLYVLPAYQEIGSLQREIVKLRKEIAKYKEIAAQKEFLEKKIAARKIFLKKLIFTLPTEKEIPELLSNVSEQAKRSGLTVISFKPQGELRRNYYNIIPFEIRVKGDFQQLVLFLDKVAHLPRIITLNDLNIQMKQDKEGRLSLEANCRFHTYRYTGKKMAAEGKKARKGKGRRRGRR